MTLAISDRRYQIEYRSSVIKRILHMILPNNIEKRESHRLGENKYVQ